MTDCEFLKGCVFFKEVMPIDIGLGAMFKKRYCEGNQEECARYMIYKTLGKEKTPIKLHPNMVDRAREIIAKG